MTPGKRLKMFQNLIYPKIPAYKRGMAGVFHILYGVFEFVPTIFNTCLKMLRENGDWLAAAS